MALAFKSNVILNMGYVCKDRACATFHYHSHIFFYMFNVYAIISRRFAVGHLAQPPVLQRLLTFHLDSSLENNEN